MFCRFRFESEYYREMDRLPMHLRMKLDVTGIRISLKHWLAFSLEERWWICELPVVTAEQMGRFAVAVDSLMVRHTGAGAARTPLPAHAPWDEPDRIPQPVLDRSAGAGSVVAPGEWRRWSPCQRYALVKLAVSSTEREKFNEALQEFRQG